MNSVNSNCDVFRVTYLVLSDRASQFPGQLTEHRPVWWDHQFCPGRRRHCRSAWEIDSMSHGWPEPSWKQTVPNCSRLPSRLNADHHHHHHHRHNFKSFVSMRHCSPNWVLLLLRVLQVNWSVGAICFYWPDALPDAIPSTSSVQGTSSVHGALVVLYTWYAIL